MLLVIKHTDIQITDFST